MLLLSGIQAHCGRRGETYQKLCTTSPPCSSIRKPMRELPNQHQQPRPSIASVSQNRKTQTARRCRGPNSMFWWLFSGEIQMFLGSLAGVPSQSYRLGVSWVFLWKRAKANNNSKSSASMDGQSGRATDEQMGLLPTVSPSNNSPTQRSMRKRRMGMRWGSVSPCRRRRRHRHRPPSAHRGSTSCAGNAPGCAHPAQDTSQSTGLAHHDAS